MEIASFIMSLATFIIGAFILVRFDKKIKIQTVKLNEQQEELNTLQLVMNKYQLEKLKLDDEAILGVTFSARDQQFIITNTSLSSVEVKEITFLEEDFEPEEGRFQVDRTTFIGELPSLKSMEKFRFNIGNYPRNYMGQYIIYIEWFDYEGIEHNNRYNVYP